MTATENIDKALQRRIKQHIIAKTHEYHAVVQPGFEETAYRELTDCGIIDAGSLMEGGVDFTGKLETCYRANISSRTISRILMRLTKFKATSFGVFNKKIEKFPWELYLSPDTSIHISITAKSSRLYHTGRLYEEAISGITARLIEFGISVGFADERLAKSVAVHVRMENDICHLSIDSSGELLYKRGIKTLVTEAPIRETIAASILLSANILHYDVLLDPMCGSGTFSIEGGGLLSGTLPGLERNFSFMQWPAFSSKKFEYLKKKMKDGSNRVQRDFAVYCSDRDPQCVSIAEKNIRNTEYSGSVTIACRDFFKDVYPIDEQKKTLIVLNPPYGNRISKGNITGIYREIGKTVRTYYARCGYAIVSPGLEYEKILSLPYDRKIMFRNGGIRVGVIIKDV